MIIESRERDVYVLLSCILYNGCFIPKTEQNKRDEFLGGVQ